jgi:hypothetical protein
MTAYGALPARAAATADFEFIFSNGEVFSGSTGGGDASIPHEFFDDYYGGHENVPFEHESLTLHVSCSESFPGGWASSGNPFPNQTDHPDWHIASYTIQRTLGGGQIRNCAETFDPGSIKVVKNTTPETSELFSFDLHGDIPPDPGTNGTDWDAYDDSQDVAGNGGMYTWTELETGEYTLSEDTGENPGDYEFESLTCVSTFSGFGYSTDGASASFDLHGGETVTCTFTNATDELPPEPGRIIVEKEVTEGSDTSQSFVFSASYDGDGFSLADGESDDSGELAAGTYSVSETVPAGWSLESATCDDQSDPSEISLQEGETVTCTFVNDELPPEPGRIIVEKEVILGDQTQAFTFVTTGFDLADNTLAHGESSSSGDLSPGSYGVSETLPSEGGWSLDSASCDNGDDPSDITLDEGDVVTCTFINSQPEVQASVLVTVDGSCTTNDDGSGTGTVTVVVSVDGGATVVIKSGADTIATFTEDGSVEVPIGQTYTWEATPSEGFEFPPGFVSSGTVDVVDCTEVLPFTGIDTERLLGLSILLLGAGVMLVVASRGRGKGKHSQG